MMGGGFVSSLIDWHWVLILNWLLACRCRRGTRPLVSRAKSVAKDWNPPSFVKRTMKSIAKVCHKPNRSMWPLDGKWTLNSVRSLVRSLSIFTFQFKATIGVPGFTIWMSLNWLYPFIIVPSSSLLRQTLWSQVLWTRIHNGAHWASPIKGQRFTTEALPCPYWESKKSIRLCFVPSIRCCLCANQVPPYRCRRETSFSHAVSLE